MLKEAKIIVPAPTSTMRPRAVARYCETMRDIERGLVTAFGGFTATPSFGTWRDDSGELVSEPVTVFTVACEDQSKDHATLRRIALYIREKLEQDCVYVKYPNGTVTLVEKE